MKYTLIVLLAVLWASDIVHCEDDTMDGIECAKEMDQVVTNFLLQMKQTVDDVKCLIKLRVKKYLEKDGLGVKLVELGKLLNKRFESRLEEFSRQS
ncbi:hypothetical protein PHET_01333 [Paragonimus heterotremus]|uniref:Uncharacterized protein n=1 Tax=Paragonimus heterotremus TaxID=100268 RepID=A0A8J4WLC8_9TREM|nr:hypothetical protein PHET_01333 [Paragonimus heterotremus]